MISSIPILSLSFFLKVSVQVQLKKSCPTETFSSFWSLTGMHEKSVTNQDHFLSKGEWHSPPLEGRCERIELVAIQRVPPFPRGDYRGVLQVLIQRCLPPSSPP